MKSLPLAIAFVLTFGLALGGVFTTMDIVAARILDEDKHKSGLSREGIYTSLLSMLSKTNGLFNSLAFFLVFKIYGFENGENPGEKPDAASRFLAILFPIGVFLVSVIVSHFLKFKQTKEEPSGESTQGR